MSEIETLARNLFGRADGTRTTNFKVFLGRDSEVRLEDVCAEINKVFAQGRNGCLSSSESLDGGMNRYNISDFLASA